MRIVMSGSEWFGSRPGGLNRYFEELRAALDGQEGVEVEALAFGDAPRGAYSWGPTGLSFIRRVLASGVDDSGADVLDRHFGLYGRRRFRSSSRKGAVRVVHFHGPWAAESRVSGGSFLGNWLKRRVELIRYTSADAIVVLSDAFRDLLVRAYGIPAEKIHVIAPGVRVPARVSEEPSQEAARTRPVVLCVRRLERRMGIDDLLHAWPKVIAAHPRAELHIVGEGTEGANLRQLSEKLGLESSVHFLGRLSDSALDEEYAASTVTVVPTRALEGFGLIALESLARGKAPIVTNCGGLPDSVRELDETLVVEPSRPQQLSSRLNRALAGERPSEVECLRHAAKFTWTNTAIAHLEVYRELLASR